MDTIKRGFASFSEVTSTFGQVSGTSYMLPVIAFLILVIVIGIIVVVSIQYSTKRPAKEVKGPIDLFAPASPVIVDRPTITKSMTNSYTLSFFLQIDAVPDMRVGAIPLLIWPSIWALNYNAAQEELVWTFMQTANSPKEVRVKPIPLQRWNQIVITYEGRTADIYCNGVLISSTTLDNVTPLPNASITIVPNNVMGKAAHIQVWSRRLTVGEVAANYVDTSDSQGRPYLDPEFIMALKGFKIPNIFCPSGKCTGDDVPAASGLKWEFPYQ